MASKLFFRRWEWPLLALSGLLIALALLALLALVGVLPLPGISALRSRALPNIEIVNQQPLKVNHSASLDPLPAPEAQPGLALSGAPRADLPLDFFDFGVVSAQAVVQHEFLLVNRGSAPLIIQQAYTTCGCTTADVSARVIPPGKAARATLIFNAGYHPASGQTVRRGLILETNDPDHPQVEIWVQAAVGR